MKTNKQLGKLVSPQLILKLFLTFSALQEYLNLFPPR